MPQYNKVSLSNLNHLLALIPTFRTLLAFSASSAATGNLGLTSAPGVSELLFPAASTLSDYFSI